MATWPEDENSAFSEMGFTPPSEVASVKYIRDPNELHLWSLDYWSTVFIFHAKLEITLKPDQNRNWILNFSSLSQNRNFQKIELFGQKSKFGQK